MLPSSLRTGPVDAWPALLAAEHLGKASQLQLGHCEGRHNLRGNAGPVRSRGIQDALPLYMNCRDETTTTQGIHFSKVRTQSAICTRCHLFRARRRATSIAHQAENSVYATSGRRSGSFSRSSNHRPSPEPSVVNTYPHSGHRGSSSIAPQLTPPKRTNQEHTTDSRTLAGLLSQVYE